MLMLALSNIKKNEILQKFRSKLEVSPDIFSCLVEQIMSLAIFIHCEM